MQNYQDIPDTTTLQNSRLMLLNNILTALSCSSGAEFPTSNLQVGMLCLRTDLNKLYQLTALTPKWVQIADLSYDGTNGITFPDGSQQKTSAFTGFRNKIINGGMRIDQRNAGVVQIITAGSALAYTVDRFYAYSTGGNVVGQRVEGPIANTYRYLLTGAASVTAVGFGTRLEADDTAMMAGSTAALQVKIKSSSLTSIAWAAYYANTKDSFGTRASPARTQIATGAFTINSTEATYTAIINIPAAATTGIEIVFTSGALLANQTLSIGDIQFESGSIATPFEYRPYAAELSLCQRYYWKTDKNIYLQGYTSGAGGNTHQSFINPVQMRASPTATSVWLNGVNNQLQIVIATSRFVSLQLIANGAADYAVEYAAGNSFTAEL